MLYQSLIQRSYRDDIPSSAIERFLPLVLEQEEEGSYVTPCFSNAGINYLHIRHNNLYRQSHIFVASLAAAAARLAGVEHVLTRSLFMYSRRRDQEEFKRGRNLDIPAQARLCASTCSLSASAAHNSHRLTLKHCMLAQVLTEYFKELEEESIRDNFVIIVSFPGTRAFEPRVCADAELHSMSCWTR